jgi:hypothetical protein
VAVLTMMSFSGDAGELAAKVRDHVAPVSWRLSAKHGCLANIVARTADGIVVLNLWESEEGRMAMSDEPEVQKAVGGAGLPRPEHEVLDVLSLQVRQAAVDVSSQA